MLRPRFFFVAACGLIPTSVLANERPGAIPLMPGGALSGPEMRRNEAAEILWGERRSAREPSRTEAVDIVSSQVSLLSELRAWRESFDGRGPVARRQLWKGELAGSESTLALGNVGAPTLAGFSGAGVAARWGRIEVGTTFRPEALGEALGEWDEALTGVAPTPGEKRSVSWLRGAALQGKDGELELGLAYAQREQTGSEGLFWNARARMKLPGEWQANGEATLADVNDAPGTLESKQQKTQWRAAASGPIPHFWGAAKASLEWRDVESGYADLMNTHRRGERSGRAQLTQEWKVGRFSGVVRAKTSERERDDQLNVRPGDELSRQESSAEANARLSLSPELVLRAEGRISELQTETVISPLETTPQELNHNTQSADIGLEWQATNATKLTALVGETRNTADIQGEEARLALEMRHQTKATTLAARYALRENEENGVEALRLEVGRKFRSWSLKTTVEVARDDSNDFGELARRAGAQLGLGRTARLDLSYRDGLLARDEWWRDPLVAPVGKIVEGREWNTRFELGGAQDGDGLGLSLEYAERADQSEAWRVGISYR